MSKRLDVDRSDLIETSTRTPKRLNAYINLVESPEFEALEDLDKMVLHNDGLRLYGIGGSIVLSDNIRVMPVSEQAKILKALKHDDSVSEPIRYPYDKLQLNEYGNIKIDGEDSGIKWRIYHLDEKGRLIEFAGKAAATDHYKKPFNSILSIYVGYKGYNDMFLEPIARSAVNVLKEETSFEVCVKIKAGEISDELNYEGNLGELLHGLHFPRKKY